MAPTQAAAFMGEWGVCLVRLGRYPEAEAPLLEAHRRLTETSQQTTTIMSRVLGSLQVVCEQTDRPDEAARWRGQRETLIATTRATSRPTTSSNSSTSLAPLFSSRD
jgi:hypothetical protein